MSPDIVQDLESKKKAAQEAEKAAEKLKGLALRYSDLKKYTGRWDKVAYYSASVNSLVADYDMRHNCGCCSDSPLEVWPYVVVEGNRVYSDPPMFQVGERHYDGGDTPYPGWDAKMRNAGIPETIISSLTQKFKRDEELREEESGSDDD